jgi:hypothetical protein
VGLTSPAVLCFNLAKVDFILTPGGLPTVFSGMLKNIQAIPRGSRGKFFPTVRGFSFDTYIPINEPSQGLLELFFP